MSHRILPTTPTAKNAPEQFSGDVWVDPIASPQEDGQTMVVARVRFAPRRTHHMAFARQGSDSARDQRNRSVRHTRR